MYIPQSASVGVYCIIGKWGCISHNWQVGEYIAHLASVGVYPTIGTSGQCVGVDSILASVGIYSKLSECGYKL